MSKKYIYFSDDEESVSKYFKEVKKTKLLTPEEEVELAIEIQNGNQCAVDKLVKANLKFVISIAKEYQGQGLSLSDLISEGNLGMVKAATRFDHTRGFRFISYAVWWVKQAIKHSLNENSRTIRYPTNVINKISATKREFEKFELENERTADFNDFNDQEGFVDYKSLANCTSLDKVVTDDGGQLHELISDEDYDEDFFGETETVIKSEINTMLDYLDVREKEIIESYYGINNDLGGMTLEVIGEKYGLTKERIRQIKNRALRKLRHNSDNLFSLLNNM